MLTIKSTLTFFLTVAISASVGWGSYMTSFESPSWLWFDGAWPGGRDGWQAYGVSPLPSITDEVASDGSQSVWLPKRTANNNWIHRSFSTTEASPSDNGLTFDFMPGSGSGFGDQVVRFDIYTDDGYVKLHLINPASPTALPSMEYSYGLNNQTSDTTLVPDGAWHNEQWNSIQFLLDKDDQAFNISVNGHHLLDISVDATTGLPTRITDFWVFEENNNDVYVDNVRVGEVSVPEPTSATLLGLGGLWFLFRRRRNSAI